MLGTEMSPSPSSSVLLHCADFLADAASTVRDCAKYSIGHSHVDSLGKCSAFSNHFPQLPFIQARAKEALFSLVLTFALVQALPCSQRTPLVHLDPHPLRC